MNGVKAIQTALEGTRSVLHTFLSDFSDSDLFVRPTAAANHAAWQIGNVIVGDHYMVTSQLPDVPFPELPAGFAELHGPDGAKENGPKGFLTKAEYLET